MGRIKFLLAAACAVMGFSAYGQVLEITPVGDVVLENGQRAYVMPQTTVVVDITVAMEKVVTGPYARFAQEYFGVIAPLADKETYSLVGAELGCYDMDRTPSHEPGMLPADRTAAIPFDGSDTEFPRVLPDRQSTAINSPESAARDAANAVFFIRQRRAELVTGDYAETVYGAGLGDAIDRLDKMEREYLELFFGKRTVTTVTKRYVITPQGSDGVVICRFRDNAGLLPADDLSGEPIVLECRPRGTAASVFQTDRRRASKTEEAEYAVKDMVDCRVMLERRELGAAVLPMYQYGVKVSLPVK